jgi:hypothetical protein
MANPIELNFAISVDEKKSHPEFADKITYGAGHTHQKFVETVPKSGSITIDLSQIGTVEFVLAKVSDAIDNKITCKTTNASGQSLRSYPVNPDAEFSEPLTAIEFTSTDADNDLQVEVYTVSV